MAKYDKLKEHLGKNIPYNKPIKLKKIESILEIDRLPKSYYKDNSYWNKNIGIGKVLNELNIKANLKEATITFIKK